MATIIHERPGVYSSYDASAVIRSGRSVRVIGVAAKSVSGTANSPVTLTSYEAGVSAFGEDAEGSPGMSTILRLLFLNSAATVVAVAVDEDDYAAAFAALEAEEQIAAVKDDLDYQLAYEALGSEGDENGPYRYPENPNYNLTPSQRFLVVRNYYMQSTEDPDARLAAYAKDTLARQYLGEFYVTLYDLLAAYC